MPFEKRDHSQTTASCYRRTPHAQEPEPWVEARLEAGFMPNATGGVLLACDGPAIKQFILKLDEDRRAASQAPSFVLRDLDERTLLLRDDEPALVEFVKAKLDELQARPAPARRHPRDVPRPAHSPRRAAATERQRIRAQRCRRAVSASGEGPRPPQKEQERRIARCASAARRILGCDRDRISDRDRGPQLREAGAAAGGSCTCSCRRGVAAVCVGRGVGGVTQYRQHCDDDVVTAVVTTSKIGGVVWVVFSQFSPDSRISVGRSSRCRKISRICYVLSLRS